MLGYDYDELQQLFASDNVMRRNNNFIPSLQTTSSDVNTDDHHSLLPPAQETQVSQSEDDDDEDDEPHRQKHVLSPPQYGQTSSTCSTLPFVPPWLDLSSDNYNNQDSPTKVYERDDDGGDDEYFPSAHKRKKPVVSGKALRQRKQRDLYTRFSAGLSMLTLRPYLKNTDMLFSYIVNIVDACVWHKLQESKSSYVQTLHESEFMKTSSLRQTLSSVSLSREEPWFACFGNAEVSKIATSANKHQQSAVFIEKKKNVMHVIEFQSEINSIITPKIIKSCLPSSFVHSTMRVEVHYFESFVCAQPKRRIGGISHAFDISLICKRKLWNAMILLMTLQQQRSPLEILQSLKSSLCPDDCESLLQMFAQSLLYYAIENDPDVRRCAHQYFTRQVSQIDKLLDNVREQCNTKPMLPFKKQQTDRIGTKKGSQTDNHFCIYVNDLVGVNIPYENLFTQNIFEVLVHAAAWPIESGFDYADLHTKLPNVFPKDQNAHFGCNFQIKAPYITTCDPQMCFLPIRQLLWPDAQNANDLVTLNGKTWKLEFFIEPVAMYDERNGLTKFITALNLGPHNILKFKWNVWVNVIDETNTPYGIYYHDPSFSPEQATRHLNAFPGMETSAYQKPERIFNPLQTNYQMLTVRFVKDKFHKIWKGSRKSGIAVRRYYKNGTVFIRTFSNARTFLEKSQCEGHGFLRVENFYCESLMSIEHSSFNVWNSNHVEAMYNQLPQGTLLCLDDTGDCKVYVRGNLPMKHFVNCARCDIAPNDYDWQQSLATTPLTQCQILPKNTVWMPSHVQDYKVEYGRGLCKHHILLNHADQVKANTTVYEQIRQVAKEGAFSCFEVSAVRGKNILYYSSFGELKAKMFSLASDQMLALGVSNFKSLSFSDFEARLPKDPCKCCRSKSICTQAVASILHVIHISLGGGIKNVNTTLPLLAGKILQTAPLSAAVGLRCHHDWTQGVKNLTFEVIVDKYANPDIIVCSSKEATSIPRGNRTLRLL